MYDSAAIDHLIQELLPRLIQLRHELHSSPDLGLQTQNTARKLREILSVDGIRFREALIGGDLVAEIRGRSDKSICLRADIDAVPIPDEVAAEYASRNPGAAHSCGHDGHATILAGTALVLARLAGELPVSVRFIFQPGEELAGGGEMMVKAGACDGCYEAYAAHAWPGLPLGSVGCRVGAIMAAGTQFDITITGKGCHGALPELGVNPVPIAAEVVKRTQQLHQELNSKDGTVVSTCVFQSGSVFNVIPDTALLKGTARYTDPAIGKLIEESIRRFAKEATEGTGACATVEFDRSYSVPTINSQAGFARVRESVDRMLSADAFVELPKPSMCIEDFAYYLQGRDGAMFFLGMGEDHEPLHSPRFDFDDRAIDAGIKTFCGIILGGHGNCH